ncbi:MAG TPA: DUF2087 domain-containing protein [Pseudomonadales bacterium]
MSDCSDEKALAGVHDEARASVETVAQAIRKTMASGRLHRIPRHPAHRDILLAIVCLDLRRRYPYTELEMNEFLVPALAKMRARVDHVTCRRYLVDLGFVRRDRAGLRYLVNFPKIESVLSGEAMARGWDLVDQAVADGARRNEPRRPGRARTRSSR